MAIPFDYVWNENLDRNTKRLVDEAIITKTEQNDDDYKLVIIGSTGTGKSNLGLHLLELFMEEEATIKVMGINQQGFADAINEATKLRKAGVRRVSCVYDDANVYSVEVMSDFLKELTRLYATIRGLNMFHIWAMPSPRKLPDDFTEELFNGLIYIANVKGKNKNAPRIFYYFDANRINALRIKAGTDKHPAKVTLKNIRAWRKKANWKGCFREYNGKLKADYLKMKEKKMYEQVEDFYSRFSKKEEAYGMTEISKRLSISDATAYKYVNEAISNGSLVKDKDFIVSGAGETRLFPKSLNKLKKEPKLRALRGSRAS